MNPNASDVCKQQCPFDLPEGHLIRDHPVMPTAASVERSCRTVIERRLLAALEDDSGKVAIIATKEDLDLIITGLRGLPPALSPDSPLVQRTRDYEKDLTILRIQAFGEQP